MHAHANQLSQSKVRAAMPDISGTVNASPAASHEGKGAGGAATASLDAGDGAGRRGGELARAGGSPAARPRVPQALALDAGVPVKAPRLISETKPVYPATARQARVDGNVVVRIVIDKAGNVVDARAIAGPEVLRGAAVDAVRQWRYEPSTLNGQPVPVQMPVTIPFRR
jgi:protein TonB